jgi:hypothetical protein
MARNIPPHDERPYGFMERELAFKLLASHGMVDHEFFEHLRRDPRAAAAELHIHLTRADLDYLKNKVDWETLANNAPDIRASLKLELVTNSW